MRKCDLWPAGMHCVIEDGRNTHPPLACGARDVIHGPCGGNAGGGGGDVGREENASTGVLALPVIGPIVD